VAAYCGICEEVKGNYKNVENGEYSSLVRSGENIIFEEEELCVIPSFGPLCVSHVMVVTKSHFNNFSLLSGYEDERVSNILEKIRKYVRGKSGKEMVFFESGAGLLTNHSGGCVIHAHIHGVFYSECFERRVFEEIDMRPVIAGSEFDEEFGYVWYQGKDSNSYYCNKPLLPSQFLRFLYIEVGSGGSYWNWRRDIQVDNIYKVLGFYGGINE
jgi:diadenosine tetraphosphate (Ap4A) HIT family hydrolase